MKNHVAYLILILLMCSSCTSQGTGPSIGGHRVGEPFDNKEIDGTATCFNYEGQYICNYRQKTGVYERIELRFSDKILTDIEGIFDAKNLKHVRELAQEKANQNSSNCSVNSECFDGETFFIEISPKDRLSRTNTDHKYIISIRKIGLREKPKW